MTVVTPTSFKVASHWAREWKTLSEQYGRSFCIDLGEPTCFACGQGWNGRYDVTSPTPTDDHYEKQWKKAPLQKCHLVAAQFGGRAVASNLILLCKLCHEEAPDTESASLMLQWALNHRKWFESKLRDFEDACTTFGVKLEEILPILNGHASELIHSIGQHLSPLRGPYFKPSSWVAVAIEWKAQNTSALASETH